MSWSVRDIPDQSGRTAVVTGANSGLGFITARELALAGATVVLACRDTVRGEEAASRIVGAGVPGDRVSVAQLDLADLASIASFASGVAAVDLLINNAGVMAIPPRRTADGFEMQFGTNHLGHFALTAQLLRKLLVSTAPRVVTVTSAVGYSGKINFEDLNAERKYRKWPAYAQSKLANLLFAEELQRRAAAAGTSLLSLAAHPGYASTNLQARGPQLAGSRLGEAMMGAANVVVAQSAAAGALPSLYAATAAGVRGGALIGPGFLQYRGAPRVVRPLMPARERTAEVAGRLWVESEGLTGVDFTFPG